MEALKELGLDGVGQPTSPDDVRKWKVNRESYNERLTSGLHVRSLKGIVYSLCYTIYMQGFGNVVIAAVPVQDQAEAH